MNISAIADTLHDAVVESFSFDLPRRRLVVLIWDKQVSAPITWLQLTISGIKNTGEVQQVQAQIDAILAKKTRSALGYRIDKFKYREQPVSKQGAIHVVLDIDHLLPMQIDCAKFTLQKIVAGTVDES